MDLTKCKLICRSRAKLTDKPPDCKYWGSSSSMSQAKYDTSERRMKGMYVSKSTVRLREEKRSKMTESPSFVEQAVDSQKKLYVKLPPLEINVDRQNRSVLNIEPCFKSVENYKGYLRPNGLVPIHKPRDEKESKIIYWNPPISRNGPIGSKFTNVKPKSPTPSKHKQEIEPIFENDDSSESSRMITTYKEPYIQILLERKAKDFDSVFNNAVPIM